MKASCIRQLFMAIESGKVKVKIVSEQKFLIFTGRKSSFIAGFLAQRLDISL